MAISYFGNGANTYDMYGLSTDEKPMYVENASTFYEMDTCLLYMFDEENQTWLPQSN